MERENMKIEDDKEEDNMVEKSITCFLFSFCREELCKVRKCF